MVLLALGAFVATQRDTPPGTNVSITAGMVEGSVKKEPRNSVFPDQAVLRPLPVSLAKDLHEWTAGDAKEPEVIARIAHNPDEALRMIEENDRIHRRQLVYRKETAATVVRRARVIGEPVRHLTLPALDGRELTFEVAHAEIDPTGHSGSLAGRVAGQSDSMVILSFRGGREAFSVIAPSENLHLQADPREPGEVIVKHIDPATYIKGGCGNPDHKH
jgi:hypothetical protein